jgi:predicted anti-sigma-YlaC factor YlaD
MRTRYLTKRLTITGYDYACVPVSNRSTPDPLARADLKLPG